MYEPDGTLGWEEIDADPAGAFNAVVVDDAGGIWAGGTVSPDGVIDIAVLNAYDADGALLAEELVAGAAGEGRVSGLATVTISKLEEGRNLDPKASTLTKLARALRCQLEQLFTAAPAPEGRRGTSACGD